MIQKKGFQTRLFIHEILKELKTSIIGFNEIFNQKLKKNNLSLRNRKMIHNIVLNSVHFHIFIDKIKRIFLFVKSIPRPIFKKVI